MPAVDADRDALRGALPRDRKAGGGGILQGGGALSLRRKIRRARRRFSNSAAASRTSSPRSKPAQTLPYLPDVARLEWLRHAAYHAADAEPMQAGALGGAPPEQAGNILLRLHPSAGRLSSDYPVVSIWETNTADAEVRRSARICRAKRLSS